MRYYCRKEACMKIHGVNLGNWLVLEKWMSPALFEGTTAEDEYYLPMQLDRIPGSAGIPGISEDALISDGLSARNMRKAGEECSDPGTFLGTVQK